MKKILLLFVVMLSTLSAYAQSNTTPIKGDVNEDGVVDVADINAIIEIMKNGGGTSGETKYYWYVGQEAPESTSVNPSIVTGAVPGWHEIGTSIGTYTFASPLYNSEANPISGSSNTYWYVAFPSESSLALYDSDNVNDINTGNWTSFGNITVNNVSYIVYKWAGTSRSFCAWWIHTKEPQTTYYWYVGKDESLIGKNGTSYNLDLSKLSTVSSIDDIYSTWIVGDIDNNLYVVCPTEWVGKFVLTDLDGVEIPQTDKTSQIVSGVTGYSILRGDGKIMDSTIKVGKTSDAPTYYWYVGQNAPESASTVAEVTGAVEGWHKIGTLVGTYSFDYPLYNSFTNPISGSSNTYWYVAFPSESSLALYDSDNVNDINTGNWTSFGNITVNNVSYIVYKWVGSGRNFSVWMIH